MKNQNNTINSDIEAKKLLNFSIKFSYSLLYNGAEVYRVEDSINRICKSFQNIKAVNAFALSNMVMISFVYNETNYTSMRRINDTAKNLEKISLLNDLSRSIVSGKVNLDDGFKELKNIKNNDKAELMIAGLKEDFINYYPGIVEWFNKIIKEIDEDNQKRELFLAIVINEDNIELAGVLILKKTKFEKKICTIRVDKKFQKMGIGTKLFEKSFEYLETATPLITLPEECYEEGSYRSLFKKYNFMETSKVKGIYRDNKIEYFFNEDK
jgi:hypothetical protein